MFCCHNYLNQVASDAIQLKWLLMRYSWYLSFSSTSTIISKNFCFTIAVFSFIDKYFPFIAIITATLRKSFTCTCMSTQFYLQIFNSCQQNDQFLAGAQNFPDYESLLLSCVKILLESRKSLEGLTANSRPWRISTLRLTLLGPVILPPFINLTC